MAALASTHPTLLDVVKRTDENGNIANIVEILNQRNDMLDDMVWIQCNNGTAHKTTMRSGIPEPTFRKLYGGVQPSKSRTVSIMDNCGMMENYAEIDKALADMNGNTAAWRLSEELPIIEGFNQKLSRYVFYGNEATEPEGFTGLAPRFNTITGVENKDNVLKAAAGAAITSVWLVVWGPNTVHMIYPNGSQAGLYSEDKGQVTIENLNGDGGRMEAYRTHYRWDAGMAVRDWRYVVRIQVSTSDLVLDAATGPKLIDLMQQGLELIPNLGAGNAAFYCNRTVRGFLRRQIGNKIAPSTLSMDQITRANGMRQHIPAIDGIPVRRCDALTNTETAVV
jgi:hypothetical protein